MIRAAGAALLLSLAAAASDPLAGRIAGPPQSCIDVAWTVGPHIVDARTILFRRNRSILYRTAIADCPALRPLSTVIVEVYGSHVCRNDRFRVREANSIIPFASCRFGAFVPYTRIRGRSD